MKRRVALVATVYVVALVAVITAQPTSKAKPSDGRQIFRFDTFGDEQLWTTSLPQSAISLTRRPRPID